MIVYACILFGVAVLLLVIGMLIFRGNTGLIHAYHQTHVTDKTGYAKAMGRAVMCVGIPPAAAGIAGLFSVGIASTLILLVGLLMAIVPLVRVQKKYNGGL